MKYRMLAGERVSALGFGAMRLPVLDGDNDKIDRESSLRMMRLAFERGVNYVDTAWPYHGGNSEGVVGQALKDGFRDQVLVADKMPCWEVKMYEDLNRIFNEQLVRLDTDRIDFYLLHCLHAKSWSAMRDLGAVAWGEDLKRQGRIRHFGFSFHDQLPVFKQIVDSHDWDFCQIQYNYLCEQVQAGTEGLHYAAQKGIDVIVMEPLFGGSLVKLPENLVHEISAMSPPYTAADLALQWVWDKPEVKVVLSGMNAMRDVEENLISADKAEANTLTEAERGMVARIRATLESSQPVPCTGCKYCMPCPVGIEISRNFDVYNKARLFGGNTETLNRVLYSMIPDDAKAAACVQCHACEEHCPQKIEIVDELAKVADYFKGVEATR